MLPFKFICSFWSLFWLIVTYLLAFGTIHALGSSIKNLDAHVLVLYSASGAYSGLAPTGLLAYHWGNHLKEKLGDKQSWNINITVEIVDVKSDPVLISTYLRNRLNNHLMGNVTAIIGPETVYLAEPAGSLAVKYGIPMILPICSANGNSPKQPSYMDTSFLIQAPNVYFLRALVDIYSAYSVQTIIVVSAHDPNDPYNDAGCQGTAHLAASRGIQILGILNYTLGSGYDTIFGMVKLVQRLNPDAVVWCDWEQCALPNNIKTNVLPMFKALNYLPKALSMQDCIDHSGVSELYAEGLFQYVHMGTLMSEKLTGTEYTEDANPYSSMFRPQTPTDYSVNHPRYRYVRVG